MKKSFVFILFALVSLTGSAATIEVCASCDEKTLGGAISNAARHDTIVLQPGVYQEYDLQITKPLSIDGKGNAVIDGANLGTIFYINTDSFSIQGLTISNVKRSYTNDYAAILVHRARHFEIKNNTLTGCFFGILVEKSHYGSIHNNKISGDATSELGSGNGIHLWHCSNITISKNRLNKLRDGIYFEFVSESYVSDNISTGNMRYGLHFMFSNHNEYVNNVFKENVAGVAIMFSKFIKMRQNKFSYNWGSASYGLLLKEIYDAEIFNNIFEQNTIGINAEGCTRIKYQNNTFLRNGWAVKVRGACYKNDFRGNNFLHNAFDLAYDGRLNDNIFEGNYWSEYNGYDLDKNGAGDIPYRPVKLFSYIVNNTPETIVLLRSLFVDIINFSEKVSPVFTPDKLIDAYPLMTMVQW